MKMFKFYILLAFICGVMFQVSKVQARPYNYHDIPLGERAFGMGGVSMALTGDTGLMYNNPAVLALSERSQVSASLSAYSRIDTRTGEYVSIFKSGIDNLSRGGFLAIPSMFGGHLKTGAWTWGGTVLVPGSYENSGVNPISDEASASFESGFSSTWLGMFAARDFGPKHKAGVSVFYASQEMSERFFRFSNLPKNREASEMAKIPNILFEEQSVSSNGVILMLGGTYDWNEDIRLGYSLRLPGLGLSSAGFYAEITSEESFADGGQVYQEFSESSLQYPAPLRLGLGVAWQYSPKLVLAADVYAYGPMKMNLGPDGNEVFMVNARSIVNAALGVEYFHWTNVGFRLGILSNMSSIAEVPNTTTALIDKVHMFGGTAAVVFDKDTGSISLGGMIQGGQGHSTAIGKDPSIHVPRTNYVYTAVVGSSYKF